ncbi:MAG: hypothetical protein KDB22_17275 [Planctomycetales bacterium]|nr:hypothetical protein [Planctomycetales bacterium]
MENQVGEPFGRWVEITFDCLPLRSVSRVDVPLDASPKLAAKMSRVKAALDKHGAHNSYYLHNAFCTYHLTNDPLQGMLQYRFEGVVLTNEEDIKALSCDLDVELERETCSWLNQTAVEWLKESVVRSVIVEFDRYIEAGDLTRTLARIEETQRESEQAGGFVGMYL